MQHNLPRAPRTVLTALVQEGQRVQLLDLLLRARSTSSNRRPCRVWAPSAVASQTSAQHSWMRTRSPSRSASRARACDGWLPLPPAPAASRLWTSTVDSSWIALGELATARQIWRNSVKKSRRVFIKAKQIYLPDCEGFVQRVKNYRGVSRSAREWIVFTALTCLLSAMRSCGHSANSLSFSDIVQVV